jgi:subtilase family serine protease
MSKRGIAFMVTCVIATPALVVGVVSATANAESVGARTQLTDTAPDWLGHARHVGQASSPVDARVYLAPRGGLSALEQAVASVSNPTSPSYRHFVTAQRYEAEFEPTNQSVDAVTSWLRTAGLQVTDVDAQHRYVSVSGSASAAQQAFGVSLQRYTHDGQNVQAPSGAATVPTDLSATVLTVAGLDTTRMPNVTSQAALPPPTAFANARPCSAFYGQLTATTEADFTTKLPKFDGQRLDYAPCGYTGPQLRSAYEGNTPLTGKGITVATTLWFASPTIRQDITTYAADHGDAPYAPGQFSQAPSPAFNYDPNCAPATVAAEEALDLEAVHAMAPSANVRYYPAASCFDNDLVDNLARVVTEDKAQIVSSSWGEVEEEMSSGTIAAYQQVFLQGAMEGITFMFATGDGGDNVLGTGIEQVSYPASDPAVTAVGGTTTAIDANATIAWQTGWGTNKFTLSSDGRTWDDHGFTVGSGGGYSTLFNRPGYQNAVVPATAPAGRGLPDVAMDADTTTGFLIGLTESFPDGTAHYGEERVGGTSLATPLYAGMTALALQHGGGAVGELNPTIYADASTEFTDVAGTPPAAGAVRPDYTDGIDPSGGIGYSVRTFDQDSSLSIAPGWDDVTGVGVPNTGWLTSIAPSR